MSQADTAGQAYRLWRLQKKMDADVSDLPAGRQADIGSYLKRTGTDGRDTYDAVADVDSDAAQTLVEIENPVVQRQFVQTYKTTDADGDAVARALNRRDSLSADGRSELDGIVRRNGNDGVEFATESDSETFDAVVRPCRATGVLSVGGAGSLRSDRYYSIEAPPSSLAQSGGPCFDLPDDVSGLSEADADTIQEMYVRLDEIRENGLDADEVEKINGGFRSADEVTTGPGEDPGEVAEELNTLSKNGLDGFVDGTGRGEDYYKGVAGEADIATTLFKEHDIDPNDMEMNRDVPDASGPNDATEVDVSLDSELTVNGNTLESPDIESKYRTVGDKNDFVIREEMVGSDGSLVDQLETQLQTDGVSNELVVVFPEGYDSKLEELGLKTEIRNELDSRVSSDYTLEFTTYTELEG